MADGLHVRARGVPETTRGLRLVDVETRREVSRVLAAAAGPISREAAALAPRQSGALSRSIRPVVLGARVYVGSPLPYANVVHWGGSIRPRGVMISFPRRDFVSRAIEHHTYRLAEDTGDAIDHAARQAGFRTG